MTKGYGRGWINYSGIAEMDFNVAQNVYLYMSEVFYLISSSKRQTHLNVVRGCTFLRIDPTMPIDRNA